MFTCIFDLLDLLLIMMAEGYFESYIHEIRFPQTLKTCSVTGYVIVKHEVVSTESLMDSSRPIKQASHN